LKLQKGKKAEDLYDWTMTHEVKCDSSVLNSFIDFDKLELLMPVDYDQDSQAQLESTTVTCKLASKLTITEKKTQTVKSVDIQEKVLINFSKRPNLQEIVAERKPLLVTKITIDVTNLLKIKFNSPVNFENFKERAMRKLADKPDLEIKFN